MRILATVALVATLTAGSASASMWPILNYTGPHASLKAGIDKVGATKLFGTGVNVANVIGIAGGLFAVRTVYCFFQGGGPIRCGS